MSFKKPRLSSSISNLKPVDWERVHKRDIRDIEYIYSALNNELIRHVYCNNDIIKQRALNYGLRKGRNGLKPRIKKMLHDKVGKVKNFNEGRQTPKEGDNIIYYAQHATATCCRKCIAYWHNIEEGIELSDEQIEYFTELIMYYIEDKLQEHGLKDEGIKVPYIRNSSVAV